MASYLPGLLLTVRVADVVVALDVSAPVGGWFVLLPALGLSLNNG